MSRAIAGWAVALTVALAAGTAGAERPRLAVGALARGRINVVVSILTSALGEHPADIELVPVGEFTASASRLRVDPSASPAGLAAVGRDLRLDAIVVPDLTQSTDGGYQLVVRVVRGTDGSAIGLATWDLRNLAELETVEPQIWPRIRAYVEASLRPPESPAPTARAAASPGERETEPHAAPMSSAASTPGLGAVYLTLAGGSAMRFWRLPVLGELSPRGYDNPGFAESAAELMALYRFSNDRAGVGASIGGAYPLALASHASDGMGGDVAVPTRAFEIWGGLAAAYRPSGGGWMRFQVGAVTHAFSLDTSALPLAARLASLSYTGLRVALEAVLPLYADARWEFGVLFGTELRVASIGGDVRESFGRNPSTTLGLGGLFGLAWRLDGITPGLAVRLAAELLRYRTSFAGAGSIGTASDSIDDYVRVHLAVTYAIATHPASTTR